MASLLKDSSKPSRAKLSHAAAQSGVPPPISGEYMMNREELAWAAGFFDGEGNVRFGSNAPLKGSIRVQVGQTDRRVLDRFQKAVLGLGKVYGPYPRLKENWQPRYIFETHGFEQSQAIVAMLYQFLSPVKQEQCLKALGEYNEWYGSSNHKSGRPTNKEKK